MNVAIYSKSVSYNMILFILLENKFYFQHYKSKILDL